MSEPLGFQEIRSNSFGSSIGGQSSSKLCAQIKKIVPICLAILLFIGVVAGATYAIAAFVVCASLTASVNSAIIAGSLAALIVIAYLSHNKSRPRRDSEESEDTIDIFGSNPQDDEQDPPNDHAIPVADRAPLAQVDQPANDNQQEKPPEQSMTSISIVETTHEIHTKESNSQSPVLDKRGSRTPPDPTDHTKLLKVDVEQSYENQSGMIRTPKASEDLLESSGTVHIKRRNASHPVFHLRRIKQTHYRTMSADDLPELVEDSDRENEPDSAPLQDSSPKKTVFWGGTCITQAPDANKYFDEAQNP